MTPEQHKWYWKGFNDAKAQPAVSKTHKQRSDNEHLEPVAWVDKCRIELVTAIHFLASDYENSLGAFREDAEARRKAEGDIAHARKTASRWNWNGTTPPQRKSLPIETDHETNDGGWAVSAGGYCNIFFCEDDADDWIIGKGGDPHDPTTYTKRELTEKCKPLTDEQRKNMGDKYGGKLHRPDSAAYWYFKGIDDTEAAHGIKE